MNTEPPSPPTFFDEGPAPPTLSDQPINNAEPAIETAAVVPASDAESAVKPTGLASLGLDNAIRLRWALRDIKAKRLKFTPVGPIDLRTLIDMGYVEMQDDVPVVTNAGLQEMEIGD
jgi:hypothetical protein